MRVGPREENMNRETRVARNPDVVARQLAEGEGAVLLHLETGAYHGLNPVGLLVWDQMEGERTVADLVIAVRENVVDAPARLEEDVLAFLHGAVERDLIRTSD